MENTRKKDLIREYRERKATPGVFAVHCTATGTRWIASARNLDTQKNGIWFQLRMGNHLNKTLQAVWNQHGEAAFSYDVLEVVADENPQMIALLLKERDAHWRKELGAEKLFG